MEQIENLIIWLAEGVPHPGEPTDISFSTFQAIIGCSSQKSFKWVVESAASTGWMAGLHHTSKDGVEYKGAALTLSG